MVGNLPGRNDPCFCGSGKKFKKCHWPELRGQGEERARRVVAPDHGYPQIRDRGLLRRVKDVAGMLTERLRDPPGYDMSDRLARAFEASCRKRWSGLAGGEGVLKDAREALFGGDDPRFKKGFQAGYEERAAALAGPIERLRAGGEAAVPYLASCIGLDSWASVLAIETLVQMPPGPSRDRAVVEMLFFADEWPTEAAHRTVKEWDAERAWRTFEVVARAAAELGTELSGTFWTSLFERVPTDHRIPATIFPGLGKAMAMLYDLGHHGALSSSIDLSLTGGFDGDRGVSGFLDDPFVAAALEHISSTPRVHALSKDETGLTRRPQDP